MTKSSTRLTTRTDAATSHRLIFLFGPTGVGKTDLLTHLFHTGFSVVNADSMQVYRHLDIGSAKPSAEVLSQVEHYLIDIFDPWQQFNAGDFVQLADAACSEIRAKGNVPVVCGGTAYYFKNFLYGLGEAPPSDPQVRKTVEQMIASHEPGWGHARLAQVDPPSAKRIHPSDGYRIQRALEVYEGSGRPLSSYALPTQPRNGMQPLIIGLERNWEELKRRIELRVDMMFDMGLIDEIRKLLALGATEQWPGMQGIGYQEFFRAMKGGELSVGGIAQQIVRNSRLYAKRQYTFFRSFADVQWMHPQDEAAISRLVGEYLS